MNKLIQTEDGSHSIHSSQFNVNYHSLHGAIQETQTVFIDAALNFKSAYKKQISILGIGFGTGLNAFMTYLEANKQELDIKYTAIEAYPIEMHLAQQLNYPELLNASSERMSFLEMHRFKEELFRMSLNFSFYKRIAFFEDLAYDKEFDIIYYDAFAPSSQPKLWERNVLSKMYQALKPNGLLTTFCAKGSFKRCLKSIGFRVEAIPGPIGKREITRAHKD
ncbi:MAG: tRNA (5-methylaminomethyl-2-thiouridine)(34)-methyltransferase MnmD [Saprospiraceae bacterium]|nr:tRNA (5-methylaminomethyl-2-thiouridine)(34)-methyltransferase MnmD [Saprospiraceae bacterium]